MIDLHVFDKYPLLEKKLIGNFTNAAQLERIFAARPIKTVVEIGSWTGLSAVFFAKKVQPQGGQLFAIDPWQVTRACDQDVQEPFIQFLSNMRHEDLTDTVVPIRLPSVEGAGHITAAPDLIYIDGDHSVEGVLADLNRWYPIAQKSGATLCGDDWPWVTVQTGVIQFAKEHALVIEAEGNFWRFK